MELDKTWNTTKSVQAKAGAWKIITGIVDNIGGGPFKGAGWHFLIIKTDIQVKSADNIAVSANICSTSKDQGGYQLTDVTPLVADGTDDLCIRMRFNTLYNMEIHGFEVTLFLPVSEIVGE